MRLLLALALAALSFAAPAAAQDLMAPPWQTCRYVDPALVQACRADPDIRDYLRSPEGQRVRIYQDLPPVLRGWLPGEEAQVIAQAQANVIERALRPAPEASCRFYDRTLAAACRSNGDVRRLLAGRGPDATFYHLPWYVAGRPPNTFDPAQRPPRAGNGGADRSVAMIGASLREREGWMMQIEQRMEARLGAEVTIVSLYVTSIDRDNYIACGYAFSDGGGYEAESSGPFIFDTRGGSVLRAPPEMFRARCGWADGVLYTP
jgi:hypothetical protein